MLTTRLSIDDHLGPRERRFFGEGFKRVQQTLSNIEIGENEIRATAGVVFPREWSRKGDIDQRPHLSTIDVLLFGARLSELYLGGGLKPVLRRVQIKAGKAPEEENLEAFEISARVKETVEYQGRLLTIFDCQVGSLTVTCEIEHDKGERSDLEALELDVHDLGKRQLITDVVLDGERARAQVDIDGGETVSMVDTFVIGLQLGQALLYELDGVSRAESNTLWMRKTSLELIDSRPVTGPIEIEAVLEESRLLEAKTGTWRSADIVTEFHGIRLRCSVAHQIR